MKPSFPADRWRDIKFRPAASLFPAFMHRILSVVIIATVTAELLFTRCLSLDAGFPARRTAGATGKVYFNVEPAKAMNTSLPLEFEGIDSFPFSRTSERRIGQPYVSYFGIEDEDAAPFRAKYYGGTFSYPSDLGGNVQYLRDTFYHLIPPMNTEPVLATIEFETTAPDSPPLNYFGFWWSAIYLTEYSGGVIFYDGDNVVGSVHADQVLDYIRGTGEEQNYRCHPQKSYQCLYPDYSYAFVNFYCDGCQFTKMELVGGIEALPGGIMVVLNTDNHTVGHFSGVFPTTTTTTTQGPEQTGPEPDDEKSVIFDVEPPNARDTSATIYGKGVETFPYDDTWSNSVVETFFGVPKDDALVSATYSGVKVARADKWGGDTEDPTDQYLVVDAGKTIAVELFKTDADAPPVNYFGFFWSAFYGEHNGAVSFYEGDRLLREVGAVEVMEYLRLTGEADYYQILYDDTGVYSVFLNFYCDDCHFTKVILSRYEVLEHFGSRMYTDNHTVGFFDDLATARDRTTSTTTSSTEAPTSSSPTTTVPATEESTTASTTEVTTPEVTTTASTTEVTTPEVTTTASTTEVTTPEVTTTASTTEVTTTASTTSATIPATEAPVTTTTSSSIITTTKKPAITTATTTTTRATTTTAPSPTTTTPRVEATTSASPPPPHTEKTTTAEEAQGFPVGIVVGSAAGGIAAVGALGTAAYLRRSKSGPQGFEAEFEAPPGHLPPDVDPEMQADVDETLWAPSY